MVRSTPFVVLLCKFRDNQSDPPVSQDLFKKFFTTDGANTFNAVNFFHDMSHRNLDLSGSRVFGWFVLPANVGDLMSGMDPDPPGWDSPRRRNNMMTLAKQAARQNGIPLDSYFGIVLVFNIAVGGSQGGTWAGGPPDPGVFSDWRYVAFNGTQSYGQEMGHAYGLNHSRRDGSNDDYQDQWDIMSTFSAYSADDIHYVKRGPGLNACNMRAVGWLNEQRVWRDLSIPLGSEREVLLRPLHRYDLPGLLAAELPPYPGYLVEFRSMDRWDRGLPSSAILIHRLQQNYSYLMSGTEGQLDLVSGGVFENLPYVSVRVVRIDDGNQIATLRIIYRPISVNYLFRKRNIPRPTGIRSLAQSLGFLRPPISIRTLLSRLG